MRFSVLLPTRNRLDLLRYAIETVRRQDYDDWEIVVSDNASEQDISGFIQSLNEPRIKYVRTRTFVPVTSNWNNALENSSGEYIVMLGDDDCLLNGFFKEMHHLIEEFRNPDAIYTNSLLYSYPGVMQEYPEGFLQPYGYAPFFRNAEKPFLLDRSTARSLVQDSMRLRMTYTFNMQHSVVKREFIRSLNKFGPFYQSPYPDFYATNVIFLKADTLVINPKPLVVIGISPKSFGYFYFNDQEKKGSDFLNNLPDEDTSRRMDNIILPGLADKTAWLIAMETIKINYEPECLKVDYNRYRYLQILHVYGRFARAREQGDPHIPQYRKELKDLISKLHPVEIFYLAILHMAATVSLIIPHDLRDKIKKTSLAIIGQTPQLHVEKDVLSFQNILEVFEQYDH